MTEDKFVNKVLISGYNHLNTVKAWEPTQYWLKKENGRERSFMRNDKLNEVVFILKKNPNMSVDEIEAELSKSGMNLSIVDKIYLLRAKREELNIRVLTSAKALKEYEEYGFGTDPRIIVDEAREQTKEIDAQIEKLKTEYRKLFPKREIYN